jgi:hypothetical protein
MPIAKRSPALTRLCSRTGHLLGLYGLPTSSVGHGHDIGDQPSREKSTYCTSRKKDGTLLSRSLSICSRAGVSVMPLSYYASRANLYYLHQKHPDWSQAEYAAAAGRSKSWVGKWLKRFEPVLLSARSRSPVVPVTCSLRAATIYRILKANNRIAQHKQPMHQPQERPAPMMEWQIDFKDIGSVPADPEGKQQHVVETLNIIDIGTSVLLNAHVRSDFTAETALEALVSTLAKYGRPQRITLDRDPRWVGSPAGSDFPAALIRGWRPAWVLTSTSVLLIRDFPAAIVLHTPPSRCLPPYLNCRQSWTRTAGSRRLMGCIWNGSRGSTWHDQH